jgi:arabinose-5-phosphate isomerase
VAPTDGLKEIIVEITKNRLGVTAVTDTENTLLGIITDGDIRRMLERDGDLKKITAVDIMSRKPKTIDATELAVAALDIMRKNEITQLVVVDKDTYLGIVHLHDLIKEGLI